MFYNKTDCYDRIKHECLRINFKLNYIRSVRFLSVDIFTYRVYEACSVSRNLGIPSLRRLWSSFYFW